MRELVEERVKEVKQKTGYSISVDGDKICYGADIKEEHASCLGTNKTENWVVVECVCRLLLQGYPPGKIVLEETWQLGHRTKGRLDILVKDEDDRAYMMIECKTAGSEFEKALEKLTEKGDQLFSYYQQDKSAKYLCLYTSEIDEKGVRYDNAWIDTSSLKKESNNVKELFESWDKIPQRKLLFENEPYDNASQNILLKDLKEMKLEDSQRIFNAFLEILRRHVVSDKPNAFNKIFNLFLC
ncbi:MAG: type I restriction enzyme HsdR N-terminal domain-containing protein, partial [Cytophagales bacterium]|nr:type I restriction enzyme HsdR N-terminal domain-containing protein [Cytophagales bacterium]